MYEYVIVFSSFYKALYAQERLSESGIKSGLMRVPPNLMNSCGYGVFLKRNAFETAKQILQSSGIAGTVFRIEQRTGKPEYRAI